MGERRGSFTRGEDPDGPGLTRLASLPGRERHASGPPKFSASTVYSRLYPGPMSVGALAEERRLGGVRGHISELVGTKSH